MKHNEHKIDEAKDINRIQLILADKRTSLSVLRTGLALISLPMSLVALLVATSKFYDYVNNLHFLIPLLIMNTALVVLGISLITRAWRRILKMDETISSIAEEDEAVGRILKYRKQVS